MVNIEAARIAYDRYAGMFRYGGYFVIGYLRLNFSIVRIMVGCFCQFSVRIVTFFGVFPYFSDLTFLNIPICATCS